MCGICGEVRFDGGGINIDQVAEMRDRLIHRGPDSAGLYISPELNAGLGFRRLSIIDLSDNASQPLPNEDGTVQVVFNGEIYNFASLRQELLTRGHRFRSHSDTEVIVHLYEEEGAACVDRLDGMFAFAIWDDRNGRLILARDRAGKKPLFYRCDMNRVVFASEIKAFFGRSELNLEIDPEAIQPFFLYGYVPSPRTFYRHVYQVEPGTVITVTHDGRISTRQYWRLEFPAQDSPRGPHPRQDDIRTVRNLVTAAVGKRLVSDVPLGAFLSGGIDSTIIVGVMSEILDRPVKTFSIGFKDAPGYDETAYARLAADRFKTDHTEYTVEPASFGLIEKLVWHHDGPFADASAIPTFIVSQLTRRQVTVTLTGDGGDELFAGYDRIAAALLGERVPRPLRRLSTELSKIVPAGATARHQMSRVKRFFAAAGLPLEDRLTFWVSLFYSDLQELIAPVLLDPASVDRRLYLKRFQNQLAELSPLNRLLLINFNTYLLDDLLVKTDRCTMANGLEARCPFLDTALTEFVATLPDRAKTRGRKTKIILREAFSEMVPEPILRRRKMGFGIPLGLWFRDNLREMLHDLLLSDTALYRDYLSASYVHQLVRLHDRQRADFGLPLWSILSFEIWLRSLAGWMKDLPVKTPAVRVSAPR
jgi:asparagine synthase (glutamine-hydrolysing)